ncbi:MAG: hypothetical protein ACLQCU_15300 [Acidimicrobiales bacterium]
MAQRPPGLPRRVGAFGTVVEERTLKTIQDFNDPRQERRRLFSEVLGIFFLVLVAAGGGMTGRALPDTISRGDAVVAPPMVLAIILFHGQGLRRPSQSGREHRLCAPG